MSEVPDELPGDLHEQTTVELFRTIQGFCNGSTASTFEIIGVLDFVKHVLMESCIEVEE